MANNLSLQSGGSGGARSWICICKGSIKKLSTVNFLPTSPFKSYRVEVKVLRKTVFLEKYLGSYAVLLSHGGGTYPLLYTK